jgi:bifunctional enzyme CysN/CysC
MVTGASTADVAIVLVDASVGLLTQTRRHAFLVSLMGIRHVVLAINKMDQMGFSEGTFRRIEAAFTAFAGALGFESITAMPISALKGDNITQPSPQTPWYQGPTLMAYLESVPVKKAVSERLVFPVQWVNRPDALFRGFSGTVAEGSVSVGDEVRVTASGETALVSDIVTMDGSWAQASAGEAVTLCLDRPIGVSRGDVLALSRLPLEMSDQFEASVVWMHADEGLIGRQYDLKTSTQWTPVSITEIKHRVAVDTLAHEACRSLQLNDIAVCKLATTRPVVFDAYERSKTLGSFILVDRETQSTVAAGMMGHGLRRAQNVHRQALTVARHDRERLNAHKGRVVWFTGLSGSGKSTLANALEVALHAQGVRTYTLDGDNVRLGLNRDLGFTPADRVENIRRIAEVARLMMDAGLVVLTAFISPYKRERAMARDLIGTENFVEVYVNTPLAVCKQRDVKGLYQKAREGKIPNMTGVNSPYEAPEAPDCEIDTSSQPLALWVQRLMGQVLESLKA